MKRCFRIGLKPTRYQGSAWLGAVPFWLDRIKIRGVPAIPGLRSFPDLNLRTYVRDRFTGTPGIYCFSVSTRAICSRWRLHVGYITCPTCWAEMHLEQRSEREFAFYSRRRFRKARSDLQGALSGTGADATRLAEIRGGSFEYFMSERPCVFSINRAGQPIRANLHHVPWPLEEAEAEIERNDLATAVGIELPELDPVLHYSRRLAVYIWPAELVRPALAARPVTVAATPT